MAKELLVPSLGESVTQITVGAWLKREGERFVADEPLVELESEKATVALPAPAAGVLARILKASGTTVAVGEVLAELGEARAAQGPALADQGPPSAQRGAAGTRAPEPPAPDSSDSRF